MFKIYKEAHLLGIKFPFPDVGHVLPIPVTLFGKKSVFPRTNLFVPRFAFALPPPPPGKNFFSQTRTTKKTHTKTWDNKTEGSFIFLPLSQKRFFKSQETRKRQESFTTTPRKNPVQNPKYFSHRVLVSFFRETVGVMSPPKAPPPNPKEDLPARPREKEKKVGGGGNHECFLHKSTRERERERERERDTEEPPPYHVIRLLVLLSSALLTMLACIICGGGEPIMSWKKGVIDFFAVFSFTWVVVVLAQQLHKNENSKEKNVSLEKLYFFSQFPECAMVISPIFPHPLISQTKRRR